MKQLSFICLLLLTIGKVYSQVTIGSNSIPNNGALLDLKEYNNLELNNGGITSQKGLLLPRVNLTSLNSLENISDADLNNPELYIGLVVYNPNTINNPPCLTLPRGTYVWAGTEWINLEKKESSYFKGSYTEDVKTLQKIYTDNPTQFDWIFDTTDPNNPIFVSGNGVIFTPNICGETRLTQLTIQDKGLEKLDITKATALNYLDCSKNKLQQLDVTKNTLLSELNCSVNQIESLNVDYLLDLEILNCENNNIESLNVKNNTLVRVFWTEENKLKEIDVSQLTVLDAFGCNNNQISYLDLHKNEVLKTLYCGYNKLDELDVSNNPELLNLGCDYNSY